MKPIQKLFFALSVGIFLQLTFSQPILPNVIFILADDMGSGDVSAYNSSSKVQTPHMDKIISEGMRFNDAHTNSSVCTPTRYGVLTGRYSWRTRLKSGIVGPTAEPLIEVDRMTVADVLKAQGYHTGASAKWHLGMTLDGGDWTKPLIRSPREAGFDYFFGIPSSLDIPPYLYVENDQAVEAPTSSISASPWPAFWRAGSKAPSLEMVDVLGTIKDKGVNFIKSHMTNTPQTPFFLYLAFTSPHTPHIVPASWDGASEADTRGDFVAYTDWMIGEVANLLDTLNISNNTILFVTADNGAHDQTYQSNGHTPHLVYRGQKADIYEAGHRVPFMVRWPGVIAPGSISNETICVTDFIATAAAITSFSLPQTAAEDSYSLLPILLGQSISGTLREATVHHSSNGTFAIRRGDMKLTLDNNGSGGFTNPRVVNGPGTLYNLKNDIGETNDLYGQNSNEVSELRALMDQYQTSGRSTPLQRNDEFWTPASPVIHLNSSDFEAGNFDVYDLTGKRLLKVEGENLLNLESLPLPEGLYMLKNKTTATLLKVKNGIL